MRRQPSLNEPNTKIVGNHQNDKKAPNTASELKIVYHVNTYEKEP